MKNKLKNSIYLILLNFICIAALASCDSKSGNQSSAQAGNEPTSKSAQTASQSTPATVAEAGAILNLSTIDLVPNAETPSERTLAGLTYQGPIGVTAGYQFYQKKLISLGWSEAENSYVSEDSASGVFLKKGFKLSLTVMPAGKPGVASFMLAQHGNVDLGTLNLAPNLTKVAVFPLTAMYTSPATPAEVAESAKTKLMSSGWIPYGFAGDSKYYKQNAIRLSVTAASAPAQEGKTMLSLESVLMSADLPFPPKVEDPRYTEMLKRVSFEGQYSQPEILKFYSDELPKLGWKSSADSSSMIDDWEVFSWRNPNRDLLTLSFWKGNGNFLRVYVQVQTAAEIAEMNKKLDEQAAAYKAKHAK